MAAPRSTNAASSSSQASARSLFGTLVAFPMASRGIRRAELVLVPCNNTAGKPGPAMVAGSLAAFKDGAEYIYRVSPTIAVIWVSSAHALLRGSQQ